MRVIVNYIENIALELLRNKVVQVKKISTGEEPFLSSGIWSPGRISIENLGGKTIEVLTWKLAKKIAEETSVDFVVGGKTGDIALSKALERHLGKKIPFISIGERGKLIGMDEIEGNWNGVVIGGLALADYGTLSLLGIKLKVSSVATILFCGDPILQHGKLKVIYLLTLSKLLEVAVKYHHFQTEDVGEFERFLRDPIGWQKNFNPEILIKK